MQTINGKYKKIKHAKNIEKDSGFIVHLLKSSLIMAFGFIVCLGLFML